MTINKTVDTQQCHDKTQQPPAKQKPEPVWIS